MSDKTPQEPVLLKRQTFLGMTKIGFVSILLVLLIIVVSITGGLLALRVTQNQRQLEYICSTTGILDTQVVAAAKQIQVDFDNGTYERLLKKGIFDQENINAARTSLKSLEASHRILSKNGSCKK